MTNPGNARKVLFLTIMLLLLASCSGKTHEPSAMKSITADQPPESEQIGQDEAVTPENVEAKQITPRSRRPRLSPVLIKKDDEEGNLISINFENTDIHTVIKSLCKLMGINYVVAPGITGNVNIQTYNRFPQRDLFQVFLSILELNSLTAVKDGNLYRIVPIDMAKQQPLDVKSADDFRLDLDSSFVTQIIRIENVRAAEVTEILKGFMSRGTDIIVYKPANMLLVTATPKTLLKFMKIIEAIDVPKTEYDAIKPYVYYVEYGEAAKIEQILRSLYLEGSGSDIEAVSTGSSQSKSDKSDFTGGLGGVSLTTYEDINALIIKSSPRDYLTILDILKRIDVSPIQPRQVLIEVMIAELGLTDSLEFGLEWLFKSNSGDSVGYTLNPVATPPVITTGHPGGFAAVLLESGSDGAFNYILSAVEGKTEINVIATPLIFATDGKKAEITIGSEVPTATSSTSSSEGISTTTQIQYRSIGTLVSVTPVITNKGSVSMEITVESSSVNENGRTIGTGIFPQFETRRATTTAVVQDGSTLFLGGLISNKKTSSRFGIPFLTRIPIIGWLFGTNRKAAYKTELFVMVTPRIVRSHEDAIIIADEYTERIKYIYERIGIDQEDIKENKMMESKEQDNKDPEEGA